MTSHEAYQAFDKPFRILAFDWDGTAVENRSADARPVAQRLEELMKLGVLVVVITGTNFKNIDRQFCRFVSGPHKSNLYVLTNRGSEVYGFNDQSEPMLIARREATAEEEAELTRIAEKVRDAVRRRGGPEIAIVYDRLNRRKIDLIPVPEWADPPKSRIGDLLEATEDRLKKGGISGGIRELIDLTERLAREDGLQARITSDVKHIELGLTDKADSVQWVADVLAPRTGVPPCEILVAGDEFGPIAGFEGSDFRMVTHALGRAVFVSVGPEPNGLPATVIHLGGGPANFLRLLDDQIALHRSVQQSAASPLTQDHSWLITWGGLDPLREHEIESLTTIGNGYLGTRGSLDEAGRTSRPATLIAGVFHVQPEPGSLSELSVAPDWTQLRIWIEGEQLWPDEGEMLEHRRILDLRKGLLVREWWHRNPSGRVTRITFLRFASLADRRTAAQRVTIVPENYSGRIRVEASLSAESSNADPLTHASAVNHLDPLLAKAERNTVVLSVCTKGSAGMAEDNHWRKPVSIVEASHCKLHDQAGNGIEGAVEITSRHASQVFDWQASIGRRYTIDKIVTFATGRDLPVDAVPEELVEQATRQLADHSVRAGFDRLLQNSAECWERRWNDAELSVEGDARAQIALRFAIYHMIIAGNPEDERVSISARTLSGHSYKGHVFWDTEIFMLPFFTYTHPPTARALLMYRYQTLPGARRKARAFGYKGAMYAWESTDTGDETTPAEITMPTGKVVQVMSGLQEHHISADVPYAIWQYCNATGDDLFMRDAGAEIIIECARFWESRVQHGQDGKFHILQVVGPDEYHESIDDNAFTNILAAWNLETALVICSWMEQTFPQHWHTLRNRLEISDADRLRWREVAARMYTGFDETTGLIEQFDGFLKLEDLDLKAFEPRSAPIDLILGQKRTQAAQVVKQADVLMLFQLLADRYSRSVIEKNFRYYEPRTGHGSSLSPCTHALLAARLDFPDMAAAYFDQAAYLDLDNTMGNAAGGIHAAACGGLWQSVVFGFAGMTDSNGVLSFDPHLPGRWKRLAFSLVHRGRRLRVTVGSLPVPNVRVEVREGDQPVNLGLGSLQLQATVAAPAEAVCLDGVWRPEAIEEGVSRP